MIAKPIPKDWYKNTAWQKEQMELADRQLGRLREKPGVFDFSLPAGAQDITSLVFGYFVYFLSLNGKVQYIGKSRNLQARLGHHRRFIKFDAVSVVRYELEIDCDLNESKFIRLFRPPFNKAGLEGHHGREENQCAD